MPSQLGRDLLLKIGDGDDPEVFTTLGVARTTSMVLNNQLTDYTSMADDGIENVLADAGLQSMTLHLDGLFKDTNAEELLKTTAFDGSQQNYILCFPNGDTYAATFVVENYQRTGTHEDLESFRVTLVRTGAGIYTAAEA